MSSRSTRKKIDSQAFLMQEISSQSVEKIVTLAPDWLHLSSDIIFIDREAGEIIRLVTSVCLFVCLSKL